MAFGIDSITNIEQVEGVAGLKRLFPSMPQAATTAFDRLHGEILLIKEKKRELQLQLQD